MLVSLSISNFALIERSSMDFSEGFTTITGETGAGKSILLGALSLVLGKRSDLSVLKDKQQKCIVEASFNIVDYNLQPFFESAELDYEHLTILRREILPNGKSRAFVNDSPVNLQDLNDLGRRLIDIHSQQQTRELTDEQMPANLLDAVAGNAEIQSRYRNTLKQYKDAGNRLKELKQTRLSLQKEYDFNKFQFEELEAAALVPGSQNELESQLHQLTNVEFIRENLSKVLTIAENEQLGLSSQLKDIRSALQKLIHLSPSYESISDRMESVAIEFADILHEVRRTAENVTDSPAGLDEVNAKLGIIYSLQQKHHVSSVEELISLRDEFGTTLSDTEQIDFEISAAEIEVKAIEAELTDIAELISKSRSAIAPDLEKQVLSILGGLGMPDARFIIEITHGETFLSDGRDQVNFIFSANKGSSADLLKKVASGGEMSRIMLAIKAIVSRHSKLPTIIFDEIDTGVSGEIANKMGEIMLQMSQQMQVFAITHLPQVAAKGNNHIKVFKYVSGSQTHSDLKVLKGEERITEIAEMISGKSLTDSAINHARALLN